MKAKHLILALAATMLLAGCGDEVSSNSGNPADGGSTSGGRTDEQKASLGILPAFGDGTVTYGLYPQTFVSNDDLADTLKGLTAETNGWVLYNDEYYAKLTADPYNDECTFENRRKIVEGKEYWFKCERIEWTILKQEGDVYTLLSNKLLDAHIYNAMNDDRNKYESSEIRRWLNAEFLNAAFNLDSSYLQETSVDNSAATTNDDNNSYASGNTNDKVFLLSYKDYINSDYGFSSNTSEGDSKRRGKTTDYARANHIFYSTSSSTSYNNGKYWTRSPVSSNQDLAWCVNEEGVFESGNARIDYTYLGVRPAITIKYSD